MGRLALLDVDLDGLASFVQLEAYLGTIEGDTAPLEPPGTELLRQSVERQDRLGMVSRAGIDDRLSLLVGEATGTPYHRASDTSREGVSLFV